MAALKKVLWFAGGAGGSADVVARAAAALAGLLLLAACTPPGWADPTEWFGGPAAPPERVAAAGASELGPYPQLGNVPGTAPRPSPQYQRDRRIRELLADRETARYTKERMTAEILGVPPPRVAPQRPAPRRARVAPVVSTTPVRPGPAPAPPPQPTAPAAVEWSATLPPVAEPLAAPDTGGELAALPPPEAALEPGGWSARGLKVGVIQFLGGSISIDARDQRILRDIALLQRQRGGQIRVVGHASGRVKSADPAGQRLADFELSLGRARNVAQALMELGVDPATLQVVAASASEPAYDESRPSGEAGNRRVEIFLEY